jgi:transposase
MANHLGMARVRAIELLRERGWSFRRIARELGVHRETVSRYVRLQEAAAGGCGTGPPGVALAKVGPPGGDDCRMAGGNVPGGWEDQNRPNPPAGSGGCEGGLDGQNRPNLPAGSSGPSSRCEPYRKQIEAALEQGLSAQRIWQDLQTEHHFAGGYDSVKRYVRRLKAAAPLPFRRIECEPGAEAQIDFGKGAPVGEQPRRRRKSHVMRVVLSCSRKAYSEAIFHQDTDSFLRCLENAFWAFGGVVRVIVPDNLKAAVAQADWYDPEINPKVRSFCEHYGIVILPTRPRTPRHKGKVERAVGYVQDNALKGRWFGTLAEQNAYLQQWESQVADTRIHGTTRRQVRQVFEQIERPALGPLPATRFPNFTEQKRKVHRDGHVEVAKAYYSVPPEYLGREVWARWDGRLVRVFNHRFEQIAVHARQEPGRFSTQDKHIPTEKRSGVERGSARLLSEAARIGPQAGLWAERMIGVRGIEGVRVLQGLVALGGRHEAAAVEEACRIAAGHGEYRLRTLRALIARRGEADRQSTFLEEHAIIRPLSEYGELVHTALMSKETYT